MPERHRIKLQEIRVRTRKTQGQAGQIDEIFSIAPLQDYSEHEIEKIITLFIKEDNLVDLYTTQMEARIRQNQFSREENIDRLCLSVTVLEHFLPQYPEDSGEDTVLSTFAGLSRNEYVDMFNQTREELAVLYYKVAFGIASSYYRKLREYIPVDLLDIVQAGNQGILDALDTFDPHADLPNEVNSGNLDNEALFFAYAKTCCHNAILRFLDENPETTLKVPLPAVEILRKLRKLYTEISANSNVEISFHDPEFLKYAFDKVNEDLAKKATPQVVSYETFEAIIQSSRTTVSFEELFMNENADSDWQDIFLNEGSGQGVIGHMNPEPADALAENNVSLDVLETTIQTFFRRSPKLYRAVCIWHRFGKPYEELPDHKKEDSYRVKLQNSIKADYRNALARLKHEPTLAEYYALLTTE